jgi:hypothetical protein
MLKNLSQMERETLVKLGTNGPGGNFDHLALNKLFTLALIEIDNSRRLVLTEEGRRLAKELAPHA